MPNLIKENIQKTSNNSSRSIKKLLRQRSLVVALSLLLTGLGASITSIFFKTGIYFINNWRLALLDQLPSIADLPIFGAELDIAQIVVKPEVSEEDEMKIIQRLESIRDDVVINGSSFATKAILYSQDPGSRSTGGKYTLNRSRRNQMVKEFEDVCYRLKEGEVSEPFETDFGWHIVMVDKVRGQELDVRHILLKPEVSNNALLEAKKKIDLIRKRIIDNELTFEEAAKSFSDEKTTKNNGGVLINPTTGNTRFELTKIDPVLYTQIQRLNDNEISSPLLEQDNIGSSSYKIIKVTNRFDEHVLSLIHI